MGWACSCDGVKKEYILNFGGETSCETFVWNTERTMADKVNTERTMADKVNTERTMADKVNTERTMADKVNTDLGRQVVSMGTGWNWVRLCLMTDFSTSGVELLGSVTTVLVRSEIFYKTNMCTQFTAKIA
jgi:hypothetical protein